MNNEWQKAGTCITSTGTLAKVTELKSENSMSKYSTPSALSNSSAILSRESNHDTCLLGLNWAIPNAIADA